MLRLGAFVESDGNYFISMALTSDKLRANVNYAAREHILNASFIWNLQNRIDLVSEHYIQKGDGNDALSLLGFRYYLKDVNEFKLNTSVFLAYNFSVQMVEAKWILVLTKE